MPYYFTPPTIREKSNLKHGLLSRVHLTVGISVLQFGSQFKQYRDPDPEDITAADRAFLGGRTYAVDNDTAVALGNAGYANYITLTDTPPAVDVDFQFIGVA